ncbi:MAG TPA: SRPBCC family protein [Bacillota bacterium]|nr:SRPBCC family protein [Bacillota bacterium]
MATIVKEFTVAVKPEVVWDALKDFGNVHTRLFPGILVDAKLDSPTARTVTFGSGAVIHEQMVTMDDQARRLVYTASGGVTTHHNASLQVIAEGSAQSRIIWTSDFLPDEVSPKIQQLVDSGAEAMQKALR